MKNLISEKYLIGILIAGFLAMPVQAASIDFNCWANEGIKMLQIGNSTQDGGTPNWKNYSVNANAGDEIAFLVHYHNFTSGEIAKNTKIKATVSTLTSKTHKISINLWSDNSSTFSDSVTLYISSSQYLSFISGSTKWYPKNQSVTALPFGQSGNEIIYSGINIGDVKYGDSESGYVTFKIKISNTQPTPTPTPTPTLSPTPTPTPTPTQNPTPTPTTTPTPPCNVPDVYTSSATSITSNSATLQGSVDPNSTTASAWFEWGLSTDGLVNETNHQNMGSGNSSISFLSGLGDLSSGTTYYFRAVAQSACGIDYGSTKSLTTKTAVNPTPTPTPTQNPTPTPTPTTCSKPSISTLSARDVTKSSATLKGSADPNGRDSQAWFVWGPSYDGLVYETEHQDIGSGTLSVEFLSGLASLDTNTTFYYKAVAENECGIVQGSSKTFKTDGTSITETNPPTVYTNYASDITDDSAVIRGSVNPKGSETTFWFEWGKASDGLNYETNHQDAGSGNSSIDFLSGLSGLDEGTTYFYRAVAQSDGGIAHGSTRSFVTKGQSDDNDDDGCIPIVTTKYASFITQNSASLRADIDPQGRSTNGWFEYGESYALSYRVSSTYVGGGSVNTDFIRNLSDLKSNTTYYFRAVGENSCGKAVGSILSFTTEGGGSTGGSPLVITLPATNVIQTSAIIKGEINPNGYSTSGWLEWGTSPTLASYNITLSLNLGSNYLYTPISSQLNNLSPNTTYYFRVVGQNERGIIRGVILSFRTYTTYPTYTPAPGPGPYASFSVRKEIKNLTFPNGTDLISASFIGDTLEYYLIIKNTQNTRLDDIYVKDDISEHFEFVESDPRTSDRYGHTLEWKIDSLAAGETKTISYRVKTEKVEESMVIPNIFKAEANGVTRTSNEATTILNPCLMSLDISAEKNQVKRGEEFAYVLRYRNIGIADVDNVVLKVALPVGIDFKSVDNSNYSAEGSTLFFDLNKVYKDEAGTIYINVKVNNDAKTGESLVATAVIDFTDIFGDPQPNISSSAVVVVESGFWGLASGVGFSGFFNEWVWLLIFLILLVIFGIFYLRYKISQALKV